MKLNYELGSIFLVPLKSGGYARGVVARMAPRGRIVFGYFFGPRIPSAENIRFDDLNPDNAILKIRFGDLGIIENYWTVISKIVNWRPEEWPICDFVRRDHLGRRSPILVRYDEYDPSKLKSEYVLEHDVDLRDDSLSGYVAAEVLIDQNV